jgi:two-component system, OmpR family, sensor histidine kinase CiaH
LFSRARWRLTLWFAGAFAIIIIVIGVSVYVTARQSLLDQVKGDLRRQAAAVVAAQQVDDPGPQGGPGARLNVDPDAILRVLSASGTFWVLTAQDGTVEAHSAAIDTDNLTLPSLTTLTNQVTDDSDPYFKGSSDSGEQIGIVARKVTYRPIGTTQTKEGFLQLGRSIEPQLKSLRRLQLILIIGGFVGMGLAAAGGWWLAGRALRPIQRSMDAQRAFVADASHELRTPLSLIRANAEMMQRHAGDPDPLFVEDIIKETDRLTYLVSQLLTLARSDAADAPMDKSPVDMNALTGDIARQMKLIADEKKIAMSVQTNGAATVEGDEQRLAELLLILLDNSIKYTESGGKVDVSVDRQDGRVHVAVADNGTGIPKESLPLVFERFYRVDKARSREMGGSGLGLAIAQWIAQKHDGRIAIDSEPGKGTKVTVDLPALTGLGQGSTS